MTMKILLLALLISSSSALNPECSAHSMCSHLTGECCPTMDFVYCKLSTNHSATSFLGAHSIVALPFYFAVDCCSGFGAECSLYPACEREGLDDFCCPTKVRNSLTAISDGECLSSHVVYVSFCSMSLRKVQW